MNFNLLNLLKNKESLWMNVAFYFFCALLVVLIFSYYILSLKVYFQNQRVNDLNNRMAVYGLSQQKMDEKKVLDYKKKIDDFSLIISNHKISSNMFSFIEKNTLPDVWFSDFDMSQSSNEIKLSGEAKNMETLSRQIQVFERNQDYVKNINILNFQTEPSGKINFILNFSLNPKIFVYGDK